MVFIIINVIGMANLIIHLGLTKTASSLLQEKAFGGKVYTLERSQTCADEKDRETAKELGNTFRKNSPDIWKGVSIADIIDADGKQDILVSHESLYEGFLYRQKGERYSFVSEPYLLSKRLEYINRYSWEFGDIKVFFFFRNQSEWLASFYSHVSFKIRHASQKDFESQVNSILTDPYSNGFQVLCYDLLIKSLRDVLGPENVMAIPYELISESYVWKEIEAFTGFNGIGQDIQWDDDRSNVKKKSGQNVWSQTKRGRSSLIAKRLSNFIPSTYRDSVRNVYWRLKGNKEIELTEDLKKRIMSKYRMSNKRLLDMCQFDLENLGYLIK